MLRKCVRVLPAHGTSLRFYVSQSPEWNSNKITRILPVVDKPKDYAMEMYRTLKGRYDELTGMPVIEAAQMEVARINQDLQEIQNQKGPIKLELQKIKEQLHYLNHSLQMCKRQDANYLHIMRQIVDLNEQEAAEQDKYDLVEERSRSTFTELMVAVQKSHGLERNQTTHFKYFSWIFSMVCGGLTISAIIFKYLTQTKEFRDMQKTQKESTEMLMGNMDQQTQVLIDNLKENAAKNQEQYQRIALLLNDMANPAKKKNENKSSTLYDWVAWACSPLRPLKFW